MNLTFQSLLYALALFVGMFLLLDLGLRLGRRRLARDHEGARAGAAAIEGALFGLLGLLIAFTFSSAASRFDTRRTLIVQEANALDTAWKRLDLLPAATQPPMRELLRHYLDSRLETYRVVASPAAAYAELAHTREIQRQLWEEAVRATTLPEISPAAPLLLPQLNTAFEVAATRTAAAHAHQPPLVFALLFLLSLTCSVFAGLAMAGGRQRSWVHMIGFAAVMSLSVYVILDLEFPRLGLIRIDSADRVLTELRATMK